MKKTLAAVAVLGAFAGSALAADVQLYGIVDTGVGYNYIDADGLGTTGDMDKFEMKSGQASGSRFGFKGTEDLGNGLTVGFILENGFDSDTGADTLFFNRESSLFVEGGFGKVAFGRIGSINNGQSSWAKMGMMSAFGTSDWGGYSAQLGNVMATAAQWDNMVAYQTPNFAGFQVFAQYGMGNAVTNNNSVENESSSDRYYALGATYANGPMNFYLAVDSMNYASSGPAISGDVDDSLTVTLGGNYDFEVAKVYLGAQYFDEVKLSGLGGVLKAIKVGQDAAVKVKGYGVTLSADAPVAGGKAMFGVGYYDAEAAGSSANEFDLSRWVVSAGYDYALSKRTNVYGVATYAQDSYEVKNAQEVEPNVLAVMVGLRHKF